jgi:hypothetical protein
MKEKGKTKIAGDLTIDDWIGFRKTLMASPDANACQNCLSLEVYFGH